MIDGDVGAVGVLAVYPVKSLAGRSMTDEQILNMNFLVSGVQGKIAK